MTSVNDAAAVEAERQRVIEFADAVRARLGRAPVLGLMVLDAHDEDSAEVLQCWGAAAEEVGIEVRRREAVGVAMSAERVEALRQLPDAPWPASNYVVGLTAAKRAFRELQKTSQPDGGSREQLGRWFLQQRLKPIQEAVRQLEQEADAIAYVPSNVRGVMRQHVGELVPVVKDVTAANPASLGYFAMGMRGFVAPVVSAVVKLALARGARLDGDHVMMVSSDRAFNAMMTAAVAPLATTVTACERHECDFVRKLASSAALVVSHGGRLWPESPDWLRTDGVLVEASPGGRVVEWAVSSAMVERMTVEVLLRNTLTAAEWRASPGGP